MMTIKLSDIFFSSSTVWILILLSILGAGFYLWNWRHKNTATTNWAVIVPTAFFCAFLYANVLPESKEAEYLYRELQKTNQVSFVLNRIIPGTDMNQELRMLSMNMIPNNRFNLFSNDHMEILTSEFGTRTNPVRMATPAQLESYIRTVGDCFSGPLQEEMFGHIKVLPVSASDLQQRLNEAYERYLEANDRKPHSNEACHNGLMSKKLIPGL